LRTAVSSLPLTSRASWQAPNSWSTEGTLLS